MLSPLQASPSPLTNPAVPFIFGDKSADKNSPLLAPPVSKAVPGGFGLSYHDLDSLTRWELSLVLLPVRDCGDGEFYTLRDILPVVGTGTLGALSIHAQRLWPNYEGRYKFNLDEARRLIRYAQQIGQKCHSREELLERATGVLKATAK